VVTRGRKKWRQLCRELWLRQSEKLLNWPIVYWTFSALNAEPEVFRLFRRVWPFRTTAKPHPHKIEGLRSPSHSRRQGAKQTTEASPCRNVARNLFLTSKCVSVWIQGERARGSLPFKFRARNKASH